MARGWPWLGLALVACAGGGSDKAPDAAAPGDAAGAVDAAGAADAAIDAGPGAAACTPACGAGQFCGPHSKTCISAVKAVSAGTIHTCAVHADGHVSCWGYGPFLVPGLPEINLPLTIELGGPASAVAAGIQATCALLRDGTVRCWGDFTQGAPPAAPARVVKEDGTPLGQVTELAGGSTAFCALTAAGTYCWGDNGSGELARPVAMSFPPLTAVLARAAPSKLITATVAIVVHDGGTRLCGWGNNDSGIIPGARGINEQPACADLAPGVLQLSAGDGHICARRGGAAFSCWGSNVGGQLGIDDENVAEAPIPGTTRMLPAEITSIASGAYHVCAVLADGTVSCWGNNELGQAGLRSSAPLFAPLPLQDVTGAVAIGSGAGASHTCLVLRDGSARCWGYDDEGQLGSGEVTQNSDRYSPAPLPVAF
jgi:alpha-tubulin suppressor-like RCC1 family protein